MPVKRRLPKGRSHKITPEAVAAFEAGDYRALHRALNLKPWEASPLPISATPLGVAQERPDYAKHLLFHQSWPKAQELQRELLKATGGKMPTHERNSE